MSSMVMKVVQINQITPYTTPCILCDHLDPIKSHSSAVICERSGGKSITGTNQIVTLASSKTLSLVYSSIRQELISHHPKIIASSDQSGRYCHIFQFPNDHCGNTPDVVGKNKKNPKKKNTFQKNQIIKQHLKYKLRLGSNQC